MEVWLYLGSEMEEFKLRLKHITTICDNELCGIDFPDLTGEELVKFYLPVQATACCDN